MWKSIDGITEAYYLGETKICQVVAYDILEGRTTYKGFINFIRPLDRVVLPVILIENDIDVLKLKCLIKARDLGWKITKLQ